MTTSVESVEFKSINFESTALNGLRGIAALHLTLFHGLQWTRVKIKKLFSLKSMD